MLGGSIPGLQRCLRRPQGSLEIELGADLLGSVGTAGSIEPCVAALCFRKKVDEHMKRFRVSYKRSQSWEEVDKASWREEWRQRERKTKKKRTVFVLWCMLELYVTESKKSAIPGKKRKGAKNSETAAKVALMKLKLHAVGDKALPQTERIYFQVYLPKGSPEKSKPMFFSSRWSVGRVVDYAASLAGLRNNNNILTAKKLRLCHPLSGEALPMDQTLESWISHTECPLYTGGNIIFEYLNNDIKGLEDADSYFIEP
ncbi:ZFAN1 protein, partial [Polypterus senegalus]